MYGRKGCESCRLQRTKVPSLVVRHMLRHGQLGVSPGLLQMQSEWFVKGSLFHGYLNVRTRSSARHKTGILDTPLSRNPSQSHWNHIQKFREGIQSFEMTTSRRRLECLAAVQASSLALGEPSAHPKREGLSRHTSHARESKDKPFKHLRGDCLLDRLCSRRASTSLHSESRERKALPS